MQTVTGNLFTRPDTLFGVCEGLGQDFGFHPNILRITLAATILWSPLIAVGAYCALGLLVMLSRLICPDLQIEKPEAEFRPTSAPRNARKTVAAPAYAEAA